MIIGLTGPKLSGKGTISAYIQEHAAGGARAFSMSGILSDILARVYQENSRANLIGVATDLRARFGEDVLAQVLAKDVAAFQKENPDTVIIIDGIRMPMEVEVFSTLPGFELWFVDASVEERFARAKGRGEKAGESTMTFEEFVAEESAVTESHMDVMRSKAQQVLENDGNIDELYAQVEGLLSAGK